MKDMKISKKELKERNSPLATSVEMSAPEYPYGLRISLDEKSIKKLGIDPQGIKIGTETKIKAMAEVVAVSMDKRSDGEDSQRIELQITKMSVSDMNNAEEAFDEGSED